tara:strand:+ start:1470 stop:2540 length:1071 start_codon:yes stop_codon:yes gene_type:complete
MIRKIITLLILISTISCKKEGCTDINALNYNPKAEINNGTCEYHITTPYLIDIPDYFPDLIIPKDNPLTVEGVALGEKLFNDPILSADNTLACINCHQVINSFSDSRQYSIGIDGIPGFRNASALINLGWNTSFNWDGSATTLEDQAFEPIRNKIEMHNTWDNVENTLNQDQEYLNLFKSAFNIDYIDSLHVVKAISQFERTLISSNSKYDKFLRGEINLTPSEYNGYAIFNSEIGDCFHCHSTNLFTDNLFHNNGLDTEPFSDLGYGLITGSNSDLGKFRTPTLRNIEYTSPYMHDGRFQTLEEVIEHYNTGGVYSSTIDPLMKKLGTGLNLTNQQKLDLIAFLKTLSDVGYIEE